MSYGSLSDFSINKIRVGAKDVMELILDWRVSTDVANYPGLVQLNLATILAQRYPKIFNTQCFGGFLAGAETIPGLNGNLTTNLATAINITLKDGYGLDVMQGVLANRSSSAAEVQWADPPIVLNSDLQLNVGTTFSGTTVADASQGRLILWIEQ